MHIPERLEEERTSDVGCIATWGQSDKPIDGSQTLQSSLGPPTELPSADRGTVTSDGRTEERAEEEVGDEEGVLIRFESSGNLSNMEFEDLECVEESTVSSSASWVQNGIATPLCLPQVAKVVRQESSDGDATPPRSRRPPGSGVSGLVVSQAEQGSPEASTTREQGQEVRACR